MDIVASLHLYLCGLYRIEVRTETYSQFQSSDWGSFKNGQISTVGDEHKQSGSVRLGQRDAKDVKEVNRPRKPEKAASHDLGSVTFHIFMNSLTERLS